MNTTDVHAVTIVTKKNNRVGPLSEAEVRQRLALGEFTLSDLAWHEGLIEWQPLGTILRASSGIGKVAPPPLPPRRLFGRYAAIGIVALLIAYAASPYVSLWRLRNALQSGDRDALESHIDFPSVRESIKDQLRIEMTKSMAKDKNLKDNPFGGLAAAFAPMMVIEWSKVRYAFFSSPMRFLVDIDGTKLHFGFSGFGWRLKKLDVPLNESETNLAITTEKLSAEQKINELKLVVEETKQVLQKRKEVMKAVGWNLRYDSPAYKLYHEWLRSPYSIKGTTEEQMATLAELERKIKTLEPSLASYFPYAAKGLSFFSKSRPEAATDAGQR
jgi:DUF2939 family protein/uncharacterized protein DUF4339